MEPLIVRKVSRRVLQGAVKRGYDKGHPLYKGAMRMTDSKDCYLILQGRQPVALHKLDFSVGVRNKLPVVCSETVVFPLEDAYDLHWHIKHATNVAAYDTMGGIHYGVEVFEGGTENTELVTRVFPEVAEMDTSEGKVYYTNMVFEENSVNRWVASAMRDAFGRAQREVYRA